MSPLKEINQQAYYNAINRSTEETARRSYSNNESDKGCRYKCRYKRTKSSGTFEKKQSNYRQRNHRTSRYQPKA